ncbi:MAG: Crp/Fnr family transcriptional regulator [Pseudomonadota bacterium]
MRYADTLRRCYLFAELPEESLAPLAAACNVETFPKKREIFAAEDEADGLRIVMSGQVRIWLADEEGHELTLNFMGAGDAFGEIALLDGLPRTANAATVEATECLFLPGRALESAIETDPRLARHLIHSVCEIMRRNLGTISNFAFVGLDARLAKLLLELALDHATTEGQSALFSRRFSQTDLALLLGVSREAVNKRFKALEKDGLVRVQDGTMILPDLAALSDRVNA